MSNKITLGILRKDNNFIDLYSSLLTGKELSGFDLDRLLELSLYFINSEDKNIVKLGYRIIVLYTKRTQDYIPLYEIGINFGFFPLVKKIQSNLEDKELRNRFWYLFQESYLETYKKDVKYLTFEQSILSSFLDNANSKYISISAPTSYGKSEIMIEHIESKHKTCVVVPTKALISQTKRRILESGNKWGIKLITHPDMYTGESEFIAILTQERFLRLMHDNKKLHVDKVFIDEAHNLLSGDSRDALLATSLMIANKRSENTKFVFISPFVLDPQNLKVDGMVEDLTEMRVTEFIKTEIVNLIEFREGKQKTIKRYDQFLNDFIDEKELTDIDEYTYLVNESSNKNIVYFNSPVRIERFVRRIIELLPEIESPPIQEACSDISEFLHENYLLIKALKRGVIYHHGSMPDNVKQYIEELYRNEPSVKYVITTSTLLEGVNLPAEKLFMYSKSKGGGGLSYSQTKNLFGRIMRFNQIFNKESDVLKGITPEVHLVASKYCGEKERFDTFVKNNIKIDKKQKEKPKNLLLKNTDIDDDKSKKKKKDLMTDIECLEPGLIDESIRNNVPETEVGKLCKIHRAKEINLEKHEVQINKEVTVLINNGTKVATVRDLILMVNELFISKIDTHPTYNYLTRLLKDGTVDFYTFYLGNRVVGMPFNEMIKQFFSHWSEKRNDPRPFVHVGKWGDFNINNPRSKRFRNWVNVKNKEDHQIVNLAILRIKEERDFIDHNFMKYIEILNDLELIEEDLYRGLRYGTTDKDKILMIKSGLSPSLTALLKENYSKYYTCNHKKNMIEFDKNIVSEMKKNNENAISISEIKYMVV